MKKLKTFEINKYSGKLEEVPDEKAKLKRTQGRKYTISIILSIMGICVPIVLFLLSNMQKPTTQQLTQSQQNDSTNVVVSDSTHKYIDLQATSTDKKQSSISDSSHTPKAL